MATIKSAAEIIAAASAAYPDDCIKDCVDPATGEATVNVGDSIAAYIAAEIISSVEDCELNRGALEWDEDELDRETDPVQMTASRLRDAVEDLEKVIAALDRL